MIPSQGSNNLLERFTELRETFSYLDYRVFVKGRDKEYS